MLQGSVWAAPEAALRGVGITILFVGNYVFDIVDENHATGVVYCKGEIQDKERWISQAIQYRDHYERRQGSWYFVRRRSCARPQPR